MLNGFARLCNNICRCSGLYVRIIQNKSEPAELFLYRIVISLLEITEQKQRVNKEKTKSKKQKRKIGNTKAKKRKITEKREKKKKSRCEPIFLGRIPSGTYSEFMILCSQPRKTSDVSLIFFSLKNIKNSMSYSLSSANAQKSHVISKIHISEKVL